MELSINLFMTLDGVCQAPGSPEEDTRGNFTRGGWLMPLFDEGCGTTVNEWYSHTTALLLGRRTYDTFAAHWPQVTDPEDHVAAQINHGYKYVVTSSPLDDTWATTTTALRGDLFDSVQELKAQPGEELQVHGSVQLARALHQAGLVDTYRFLIAPVVVGGGAGLFSDADSASTMTVNHSVTTENGVIALELTPGEFSQAQATVKDGRDTTWQT